MTNKLIIAFVAQKGGVGKSQFANLFATIFAKEGYSVKIADLDIMQASSVAWANRRAANNIDPLIRAETFSDVNVALQDAKSFDIYIIDGAPHSSKETKKACLAADLVVIPTNERIDNLDPSVILAHNLRKEGVSPDSIVFAFSATGNSAKEIQASREYLEKTAYRILPGEIPFRDAYGIVIDKGKSIIETPFTTLRKKADEMAQSIIDLISDTISKKSGAAEEHTESAEKDAEATTQDAETTNEDTQTTNNEENNNA